MKESEYRQKIFANNWNLQNSRPEISSTYPEVKKITVDLDFTYMGAIEHQSSTTKVYHPYDKEYFRLDCINPECVHTNLDLSHDIRNMIRNREFTGEGSKSCHGYQDFERFRAKGNKCLAEMLFTIRIDYK